MLKNKFHSAPNYLMGVVAFSFLLGISLLFFKKNERDNNKCDFMEFKSEKKMTSHFLDKKKEFAEVLTLANEDEKLLEIMIGKVGVENTKIYPENALSETRLLEYISILEELGMCDIYVDRDNEIINLKLPYSHESFLDHYKQKGFLYTTKPHLYSILTTLDEVERSNETSGTTYISSIENNWYVYYVAD